MLWLLFVLLFLLVLMVLATYSKKAHPGVRRFSLWAYAHRGLHGDGVPENSLKAFRKAAAEGYGAELDVHLMRDGNLAVIHDSSLKRTAGADVDIEDLSLADLEQYYLEGTLENIPEFSQVLEIFENKAPLIVELKSKGNNVDALCKAVCRYLDGYRGQYCVESFDPRCVRWFYKNRPAIIRGQLAENFLKSGNCKFPFYIQFAMTNYMSNFLTRPDFIAYRFQDRNTFFTRLCRCIWKVQGVTWTVQTQKEFDDAVKDGWIPIFEYFNP